MIPERTEQEIKAAARIYDVVSHFVTLKRSGSRYVGLCPFHSERTPSFTVTPSRNICKCFGCGKGGDATWFVKESQNKTYPEALEYLAGLYNISIDSAGSRPKKDFAPLPRPTPPPEPPPSFFPKAMMVNSLKEYERNHFAKFLEGRFGADIASDLIGRYFVGTSKHFPGANIFWQVDSMGRVRSGKIMAYNPATGKRERDKSPTWAHKAAKIKEFNLSQCFFGEHLLNKRAAAPVGIVESEKTAIVASAYLPGFVWLAAGGKEGLGLGKCAVLKGRHITLWPDAGAYRLWSERAAELNKAGYSVTVSNLIETASTDDERRDGYDLADYLLRYDLAMFRPAQDTPQQPTAHEPLPATTTSSLRDEQGYPAAWDEPTPPAPSRLQESAKMFEGFLPVFGEVEPITYESEKEWAAKRERARRWYPMAFGIERAAKPAHIMRIEGRKRRRA